MNITYRQTLGRALPASLLFLRIVLAAGAGEPGPSIQEELVVVGASIDEFPLSSLSTVSSGTIRETSPERLGELLEMAPGVIVSEGIRGEAVATLRGLESRRCSLLYDGIPMHEPYFNSFDLNSVPIAGVENVRVIRGATSVLHGPYTLGGIVSVNTRRVERPFAELQAHVRENNTRALAAAAGTRSERASLLAQAGRRASDGFDWRGGETGDLRQNSDYEWQDALINCRVTPADGQDVFAECLVTTAEYGVPPSVDPAVPARFWRFRDWKRLVLSAGTDLQGFESVALSVRTFAVNHENVLDAYTDERFEELRWSSSFRNPSYGIMALAALTASDRNTLRFSLGTRNDKVRQQADTGQPWSRHEHQTTSAGAENTFRVNGWCRVIGGLSADYLDKDRGDSRHAVNAVLGVKAQVGPRIEATASVSQRTRFPSMSSLYNAQDGNPELRDENAQGVELGVSTRGRVRLKASLFHSRIEDMISASRNESGGWNRYNGGEATISGAEVEIQAETRLFTLALSTTRLETTDRTTHRPVELVPDYQVKARLRTAEWHGVSLSLWTRLVSEALQVVQGARRTLPEHVVTGAQVDSHLCGATLYVKAENLLDEQYATEIGYPARARTFSTGFSICF